MKILAIGDVTGPGGLAYLADNLWRVRKEEKIDLCIVNAENASVITGITTEAAQKLLVSGADVITGGNHTMRQKAAYAGLEEMENFLRPINFGAEVPGRGYTVADACGYRVLVISAMGNVHMEPVLDSPFPVIDRVLAREAGKYDFAVLDLHAEATAEKLTAGFYFDGRMTAVYGTHTHVPTADEQVLPGGTGYVTDIGMCGESGGVLGMDPALAIEKMKTHLPVKLTPASGPVVACGVIFDVDTASGKCRGVRRIRF